MVACGLNVGESVIPKGEKSGETLDKKWTLMKMTGCKPRCMVEFGSVPGVVLPRCVDEEERCFSWMTSALTNRKWVRAVLNYQK